MAKFEIGQLVSTRGVDNLMQEDSKFREFVVASFNRYKICDWGDTCDEDKKSNDNALKNGERLLAVYKDPRTNKTIWIITEWDRSVTTILFPEEY